jgi:IS30 family transposase
MVAGADRRPAGARTGSHPHQPRVIYRFVYHRSAQKDYWHRLLPQRKNRRGRLRRGGISPVLHIKQRISVHERPAHVAERREGGHWEADLMCFARYDQAVLVVHERSSRALVATRQPSKAAAPVLERLARLFRKVPPSLRRSVTFDNGTEFTLHYRLAGRLGMATYFCDPHAPWQKGGVENAISRLRRPLPRKADLAQIHPRQFDRIIANYNATPRRCLGFRTRAEAFCDLLNPLHFKRETTPRPSSG